MAGKMEQNSGEIRSREAMSIFGQSIDVRRPGKSKRTRRATHKKFSPTNDSPAIPSMERLHQRRAVVSERERGRAESELSTPTGMAQELERQIEHVSANATPARSSHRSELQRTRASGGGGISRRKKPGLAADAEAPGADPPRDQSSPLLVEVMQELHRVKRELRELQREVKAAREAGDAETPPPPPPRSMSPSPRPLDGAEGEPGEGNEEERGRGRGVAELAVAGGFRQGAPAMRAHACVLRGDRSLGASDPDERFATASSSDVGLESADTAAVVAVAATEETGHAVNAALTIARHGEQEHEHEHDGRSSRQAAEAELTSARVELESIKEERARFAGSVERTRVETARVAEEIGRLAEQEERASAQVEQLNGRLLRARARLDATAAADERAEAALAELSAALREVGEETEAAEKERALTELENRCVREDADAVGAEIVAIEVRVRESVMELEAARASEAVATAKLRAAVEAATLARAAAAMPRQTSGNVAVARLEYEYLTGRPEVVRTVAEKKVAAAEAWAEALRVGEKEIEMRLEMIEKEMGETRAWEADATDGESGEELERPVGLRRAQTRRRPSLRDGVAPPETSGTPSSSVVLKQRPTSFSIRSRKTRAVVSKYLKVVTGKCGG